MTTPPLITDSHCHLDFPDFEGELPDILARAAEAGVHRMVTICTRLRNEPERACAGRGEQPSLLRGRHPPDECG